MGSPLLWFGNAAKFLKSQLLIPGSTSGNLTIQTAAITTDYTLTMPNVQGGASTTLNNNGSGVLSWTAGLPTVGTDGQLLKSMNSTYIQSSYYNPYPNYIGNAFAEVNTSGWATYSNTAANIPSTGTGGTATGLTFSRSTSSPLRDTGTFSIVQTNSTNIQGKGVSFDFTIDSADQAKALSIQMDYNASSTFVASNGTTAPLNDGTTTTNAGNSDLEIFIYDKTNAVLIPVSPQVFSANGTNNFTFKGIFQTSSNSTSYRLIIHAATSNANATGYTFKFTNVFVGPQYIVQGSPVTDWALTTGFTFSAGFGTTTNPQVFTKRVGDTMFVKGIVTTGTSAASAMSVGLPVSIDSTKLSSSGAWLDGQGASLTTASSSITPANFLTYAFYDGSTTSSVFFASSTSSGAFTKSNGTNGLSNGVPWEFYFNFPVSGWSSSTLMSNDANTRVLAATYYVSSNFTASSTIPVNFDTKIIDTHGAVTTSATAWKFIAPVSGYFVIGSGGLQTTSTGGVVWSVYKNGSIYRQICGPANGTYTIPTNCIVQMNAGDFIDIRPQASFTIPGNATFSNSNATSIDIYQIQGPAQISTTDSINARYFASSTSISGTLATIVWTTKDYDSANAMSSGVYTISVSGKYEVNAALLITGTIALNNNLIVEIQKNNTVISRFTEFFPATLTDGKAMITDVINCLAGDTIRIQVSSNVTTPSIVSSNFDNYFSIFRTGN